MNTQKSFDTTCLSDDETKAITEAIQDEGEQIEYFYTPADEELGQASTAYFGVVERNGEFHVFAISTDSDLTHEGAFPTHHQAHVHAEQRAKETLMDAEDWLATLKDEEWAARPVSSIKLEGPFRFRDNTDFRAGWPLEKESDVLAFFHSQESLFTPESWGNAYECRLVDSNGVECWVLRSHRGELQLEANDA